MSLTFPHLPEECMHAGNEMSVVVKTSLPSSTANLEILVGINLERVYDSGVNEILVTRRLKPDLNGECRFFINSYLWDAFEGEVDMPPVGGTSAFQLQKNIKRYSLFAIEYSGSPQAVSQIVGNGPLASQRFVAKGAIANARFAFKNFFGTNGWLSTAVGNGGLGSGFLDWRGSKPRTRPGEEQWLVHHWEDAQGTVGVSALEFMVRWYRSDGTSGSMTIPTAVMDYHDVYAFPAGLEQLGLDALETANDKIYKYSTWLSVDILGNPQQQTDVKHWSVDRDYYEFAIQLQFENSYGVMEQLTLRGARTEVFEIEKKGVASYRDSSYAATEGESEIYEVLVSNGLVSLSGAGTAQEGRQFAMLKASRKVFILTASHGQNNIPVTVKGGKHEINPLKNVFTYEIALAHDFEDSVPDILG